MKHGIILVFECNSVSLSDYKYVRFLINARYKDNRHLEKICAGSKTSIYSTKTRNKIHNILKRYSGDDDIVEIVLFADLDKGTKEDKKRNEEIKKFALLFNIPCYIVWFNRDIEEVFLGRRVDKKDKSKEAEKYYSKKDQTIPAESKLTVDNPENKLSSSNIILILDKIFEKR